MGLKQKIEEAYKGWEQNSKNCTEFIEPSSSNYLVISAKIRKLKGDLCKFAKAFDENFIGFKAKPLTEKQIDDTYKSILDDFVGKIASGDNHFIYGIDRTGGVKKSLGDVIKEAKSEYPKSIEIFNSKYKNLKSDFKKAEDLISFFNNKSSVFAFMNFKYPKWGCEKINSNIELINKLQDLFIANVLYAMAEALKEKGELLVAKDDEYFDIIPNIAEAAKNPDTLNKVLELFETQAKKYINDEKSQKLFPDAIKSLKDKIQAINDIRKKAGAPDPNELKKVLPKEVLIPIIEKANSDRRLEKHLISSIGKSVKVFPQGEPMPYEVEQAGVGDCYLMSTLISLAKNNKEAIKKCFVQGMDKIEKEDNIVIRFFVIDTKSNSIRPIKIAIDKNKVISPTSIKGNALWPKLIEKAYAVYRKKGYDLSSSTSENNLNDGGPAFAMSAITGKRTGQGSSEGDRKRVGHVMHLKQTEKYTPANIIETIKRKLSRKNSLTCAFKNQFSTTDVKNNEKITIEDTHAYAIVGFGKTPDGKEEYIRIIDPNKALGRTYSATAKPLKEGGHIAMSLDDFRKHFDEIQFTSNKGF